MKKLINIIVLLFVATIAMAQSPKREFRATWLTTVWSIDWPSTKITATGNTNQINAQKRQMRGMLDSLVSANMNAVCFQVRSRCDAMYQSSYEPWSTDLVSTRGMEPGYDPLAFVIEEGHKRGLEVHAWMNPYRYESASGQWTGKAGDYRTDHPDWVLDHNGAAILNPGLPEVRQRISDVIKEMITNYDVDGVLFDDYFYLSGTNEDVELYQANNPEGLSIGDWRRSNVNKMIAKVYQTIQEVKPYVRFGVSPAGIWDVNATIAASYGLTLPDVSGGYAYNGIYCDPVAWLKEGTVDYISPQVYWTIGSSHGYELLSPWWNETATHFGKQCYISHSLSAMTSNPAPIQPPLRVRSEEQLGSEARCEAGMSMLERQMVAMNNTPTTRFGYSEVTDEIAINRNSDVNDAPGSIFFSHKNLRKSGFTTYLRGNAFNDKALTPAIHWKTMLNNPLVQTISVVAGELTWQCELENVRYAVYAIPNTEKENFSVYGLPTYYLGISYDKFFLLPTTLEVSNYTFAVSVVDRYGNEYAPVAMGIPSQTIITPTLLLPIDEKEAIGQVDFKWDEIENAIGYIFELSENVDFSTRVCARELKGTSINSVQLPPMNPGVNYYWRVRAKTLGAFSTYSSIRRFSVLDFSVITPANNAEDVSLQPELSWTQIADGVSYKVEIATTSTFAQGTLVLTTNTTATSYQVPVDKLSALAKYYVRVSALHQGVNLETGVITFTTLAKVPEIPQILFPTEGLDVSAPNIEIGWTRREGVKGYRVELATSSIFPRGKKIANLPPDATSCTFTSMSNDTYYVHVRADYNAKNGSSIYTTHTDWSTVVSFNYLIGSSLENIQKDLLSAVIYQTTDDKILRINTEVDQFVTVRLYRMTGQLVSVPLEAQQISKETTLSLSRYLLPSGPYLVEVTSSLGVRKIIKISL